MQIPIPSKVLAFHAVAGAMNAVVAVRDTTKTNTPIPVCLSLMVPRKKEAIEINMLYDSIEENIKTRGQLQALCNAIEQKGRFR